MRPPKRDEKTASKKESHAKVKRTSAKTKDNIAQALRRDIILQRLRPGQAISEDALARSNGVSRTPIREILQLLAQEDLVTIYPHKGVVVSELTSKDIEEIIDIRIALESTIAGKAATRISAKQVTQLRDIEKQLDLAVQNQDSLLSLDADSKLHELILQAAGNKRAHRIIKTLKFHILRMRSISGNKPGRIDSTVEEHKRILQALLSKDTDEAERTMRMHLVNTKGILLPASDMDKKFEEFVQSLHAK